MKRSTSHATLPKTLGMAQAPRLVRTYAAPAVDVDALRYAALQKHIVEVRNRIISASSKFSDPDGNAGLTPAREQAKAALDLLKVVIPEFQCSGAHYLSPVLHLHESLYLVDEYGVVDPMLRPVPGRKGRGTPPDPQDKAIFRGFCVGLLDLVIEQAQAQPGVGNSSVPQLPLAEEIAKLSKHEAKCLGLDSWSGSSLLHLKKKLGRSSAARCWPTELRARRDIHKLWLTPTPAGRPSETMTRRRFAAFIFDRGGDLFWRRLRERT